MKRLARVAAYAAVPATVFGLSKFHALWHDYDFTSSSRFAWAIGYATLLAVSAYGVGLPDLARTPRSGAILSTQAMSLGAIAVSVVQLLTGDTLLPRFVVFGAAAALVPWLWMCSFFARNGQARAELRARVLLVGNVDVATLAAELDTRPERHALLVGALTVPETHPTGMGDRPLEDAVHRVGANLLVLAHDAQADEVVVSQAGLLHERGIRVRTLTRFYEEWLGKLPASELERTSLLFDISEIHRDRYGRLKRIVDLAFAVPGALVCLAIVPIVLAGNLAANRGPLLYRQPRVGKRGEVFEVVKFRTMRPSTNGDASWTLRDDPRITPFGRLLRTTHLDELPQMVNVLRGHLSIVGPRPEQPQYVEELTEKLPFYRLRHLVKPGLTGWAQVKYGYAADDRDALEKLQYEFYYLRHQRLGLELRIVGRTVRSVLGHGGR